MTVAMRKRDMDMATCSVLEYSVGSVAPATAAAIENHDRRGLT